MEQKKVTRFPLLSPPTEEQVMITQTYPLAILCAQLDSNDPSGDHLVCVAKQDLLKL